ncbi:phage baseplate protein [Apibacter adventoris]|uniref:phage baseplate protein n=1 Tax=Apibacter adventoris TaxID=1679466 RepID=UPI000CF6BB20|nr:hypothetical protein [Apibacter adventoris]PQL95211.1 hypothetical protein C4S76_03220 [Apibacter adventoris]
MNKLEYNNAGGFPMTTNRLEDIQETYTPPINGLAAMAGDLAIISGCNESGNNIITDGFVFINGEIFEFRGGIKLANITLFEEKINKEFENGKQKVVITKRYFTFGTGAQNYKWEDFKRIMPLKTLTETFENKVSRSELEQLKNEVTLLKKQNAVFQAGGGMVLWNKPANQIPAGWREVVDWRGRMPVGFDPNQEEFNQIGKTGGSKTHTLFQTNLPAMSFYLKDIAIWGVGGGSKQQVLRQTFGHNYSIEGSGGNSTPVNHLDPYRTVLFIEFIG